MDLSLDEIIKKKNIKAGPIQSRQQNGRRNVGRNNGRVNKPIQSGNNRVNNKPRVVDARVKIIQKNRQKLVDARDKLSELAKKTDARNKIKGRNSKLAILPDSRRDQERISKNNSLRNPGPTPLLQRSFSNNAVNARVNSTSLIRRTINRPTIDLTLHPLPAYEDDLNMPMPVRCDLSSIKMVAQNEFAHYAQEYAPEPMFVDNYDPSPVYSRHLDSLRGGSLKSRSGGSGRMSLEMRARLDSPKPLTTRSPPPSPGHRIVVSNLHPSVTHEDVMELFEDIGPLLTSRLVRPGTAEVIYKLQKDANKAVEAYHNRQLDGQPMKCLLVNPRSPPTSGVLRSNNVPAVPKYVSSSKSMVVPDLSAIHKALFTSK